MIKLAILASANGTNAQAIIEAVDAKSVELMYFCAIMRIEEIYSRFRECSGVTTDSRKCGPGLMFFALKGERFDGNEFVSGALEQGCKYAVMDNAGMYDASDSRMILVDNVLVALQQVAAYHRRQLGTMTIGITGTNGKTTTKKIRKVENLTADKVEIRISLAPGVW